MKATHAVTYNGQFSGPLNGAFWPVPEEIGRAINRLEGSEWYAVSLWALPPGKDVDQVPADFPDEYIQTAGRSDRLTVEIREVVNGVSIQQVIGRSTPAESGWETVAWDRFEVPVLKNELLTAADAVNLFLEYYESKQVPTGYNKRPR